MRFDDGIENDEDSYRKVQVKRSIARKFCVKVLKVKWMILNRKKTLKVQWVKKTMTM